MTIKVGDKVKLISTAEVSIVIHCWHDMEMDTQDNYVAFFGEKFPNEKPIDKPYRLKYFSTSLESLNE